MGQNQSQAFDKVRRFFGLTAGNSSLAHTGNTTDDAFVLHRTVQHAREGLSDSDAPHPWKSAPVDPHHADLIKRLLNSPDHEGLLEEAAQAAKADIAAFANAALSVLPKKHTWKNCISNQVCHPHDIKNPKTLDDLIAAVKEGRDKKLTVRAVGSGHSFSNVALTDGILLDTHHMAKVLPIDVSVLRDPAGAKTMFSVENGITIANLNDELDRHGLALFNMGAYDGQTIAGAICTGTHGSGATLGPICSSVLSLTLVAATGEVYQIEPSNGITDPNKFREKHKNIILKQDDDWFQSNVVAMGCMGIIYSYILQVKPSYFLKENRTLTDWDTMRTRLLDHPPGQFPSIVTDTRHCEIIINPYPVNGTRTCVLQTRDEVPGPKSGSRGILDWFAGILAQVPGAEEVVVTLMNLVPALIPKLLNDGLNTVIDSNYIDKSYKVLNMGGVNREPAWAIEIAVGPDELVPVMDKILQYFADKSKDRWWATGPTALRFVQAADAYLAPEYGRATCFIEPDMLAGTWHGFDLLADLERLLLPQADVRVHWGLEMDVVNGAQVAAKYPKYPQWLAVYNQLNASGMFNNPLTDRLGISR